MGQMGTAQLHSAISGRPKELANPMNGLLLPYKKLDRRSS